MFGLTPTERSLSKRYGKLSRARQQAVHSQYEKLSSDMVMPANFQ